MSPRENLSMRPHLSLNEYLHRSTNLFTTPIQIAGYTVGEIFRAPISANAYPIGISRRYLPQIRGKYGNYDTHLSRERLMVKGIHYKVIYKGPIIAIEYAGYEDEGNCIGITDIPFTLLQHWKIRGKDGINSRAAVKESMIGFMDYSPRSV